MKLNVNGDLVTVPANITTVTELIEHFEVRNSVFIVEHNGEILEKKDHNETKISDGDKIELVHFVGGG